ncbi:hypothetical protein BH09MYX1_BH09MYX1_35590 [soil metagenome]
MDASIRRRALRQAAKMALGAAFVGCGGAIATANDGGPSPTPGPSDDASRDGSHDVAPPSQLSCEVPKGDASFAEKDKTCCFDLVAKASAGFFEHGHVVFTDPSVVGCCAALHAAVNGSMVGYVYGTDPRMTAEQCQSCADTVGDPIACTPWGPPMPPEMVS